MNNYRKLINLIKPEFQELYAITKNVGEENSFQLARVSISGDVRTLNTLMNFRNVQNPMAVMKMERTHLLVMFPIFTIKISITV